MYMLQYIVNVWVLICLYFSGQLEGKNHSLCSSASLQKSYCAHLSDDSVQPETTYGISNGTVRTDFLTNKIRSGYKFKGESVGCSKKIVLYICDLWARSKFYALYIIVLYNFCSNSSVWLSLKFLFFQSNMWSMSNPKLLCYLLILYFIFFRCAVCKNRPKTHPRQHVISSLFDSDTSWDLQQKLQGRVFFHNILLHRTCSWLLMAMLSSFMFSNQSINIGHKQEAKHFNYGRALVAFFK